MARKNFVDLLVEADLINEAQLQAAMSEMSRWDNSLPRTLVELHVVSEDAAVGALSKFLGMPRVDLDNQPVDPKAMELLDVVFCRKQHCMPFAFQESGRFLDLAIFDPGDGTLLDEIRVKTKCNVRPFIAGPSAILDALDNFLAGTSPVAKLAFRMPDEATLDFVPPPAATEREVAAVAPAEVARTTADLDQLRREFAEFVARTDALLRYVIEQLCAQGLIPPPPGFDVPTRTPPRRRSPTSPVASAPQPRVATPPFEVPAVRARRPSSPAMPASTPPRRAGTPPFEVPAVRARRPSTPEMQAMRSRPVRPTAPVAPAPAPGPRRPSAPAVETVSPAAPAPRQRRASAPPFEIDLPPVAGEAPVLEPASAPATDEFEVIVETPASAVDEDDLEFLPTNQQAAAAEPDAASQLLFTTPNRSAVAVAMDFGTTRSSVGTVVDGQVEVLRLPGGEWDIPSVVGFRRDGTVMLGKAARAMLGTDPTNAIASPKRILGRKYDDRDVQAYLGSLAMKNSKGFNREILLEARGRQFTPTEACAHILNMLRLVAQQRLGREVRDVLLTTPVTHSKPQFQALRDAAELAGLVVREFVDEPAAAVLANHTDAYFRGLVAVYDFGGGTFDFSVADVSGDDITVVTTAGDTWLGGDDLDEVLAGQMANAFWRQHNIELRNQTFHWQRLLAAAEEAKRALSTKRETLLKVPKVAMTQNGQLDLSYVVTRPQFAQMVDSVIARTLETCREAMDLAGIPLSSLNGVFLSGGTCYIPAVRQAVTKFFGKEPRTTVPPERSVLVGAALHGAGVKLSGLRNVVGTR
jgi:actin-like ATPase involved in cell morphogenesis